jgi:hypothetical protein
MTRCHNKIIGGIRTAIEENMAERLLSSIGDNTVIREEGLSEEVRSLRPNLNFVTGSFESSHTMLIDISCPSRRISDGANTLEKVYIDKKDKYSKLAQETSNIREIYVEIIPIIVLSLEAVHTRPLEAFRNLLLCDDKEMKRIRRRLSEAAIMGSMEILRRYARDMSRTEDARVVRMTTQEAMIANDK